MQGVAEQIAVKLVHGNLPNGDAGHVNGDLKKDEGIRSFDYVCLHR